MHSLRRLRFSLVEINEIDGVIVPVVVVVAEDGVMDT